MASSQEDDLEPLLLKLGVQLECGLDRRSGSGQDPFMTELGYIPESNRFHLLISRQARLINIEHPCILRPGSLPKAGSVPHGILNDVLEGGVVLTALVELLDIISCLVEWSWWMDGFMHVRHGRVEMIRWVRSDSDLGCLPQRLQPFLGDEGNIRDLLLSDSTRMTMLESAWMTIVLRVRDGARSMVHGVIR